MSIRRMYILAALVLVVGAAFAGGLTAPRGAGDLGLSNSSITNYSPPTPVSPPSGTKSGALMPELVVRTEISPPTQYNFRVWLSSSHALVAEVYTSEPRWKVEALFNNVLPAGRYVWSCRASYASQITREWTNFFLPPWSFDVQDAKPGDMDNQKSLVPAAPYPRSPWPGAKSKGGSNVTLVVGSVADAELYHWVVFQAAPGTAVVEGTTDVPMWNVPVMMPYVPGFYYWHCRVSDGNVWGPYFDPPWWYELEKPVDGAMAGIEAMPDAVVPVAFPNPCGALGAELRFNMPRHGNAAIAVYSVEGKLVRSLTRSDVAVGPCRIAWDGKDQSGRSVGAGTYLCRITAGDASSVVKVMKSR